MCRQYISDINIFGSERVNIMVNKYSDGLSKKSVLKSGHIEQNTVRFLPVLANGI